MRLAALRWLRDRCRILGRDVLHVSELAGCRVDGEQVAIKAQLGILRPRQCSYPLSISTGPSNPYGDRFGQSDVLRYRYQGEGGKGRLVRTDNAANRGLRELIRLRWPLIYFHGVESGRYLAISPVIIVDDDPSTQTFGVCLGGGLAAYEALDTAPGASFGPPAGLPWQIDRPRYEAGVARLVRKNEFRHKVLAAYGFRCAVCRSAERELLEAASLSPGAERNDLLAVSHGIAMCPSHRTAYDRLLIGITPSHTVRVRPDLLRHSAPAATTPNSLYSVHEAHLHLPRDAANLPHPEALRARYDDFEFRARLRL